MANDIKDIFDFIWIEQAPAYSLGDCIVAVKKQPRYLDDEDSEDYFGDTEGLLERFRTAVYLCNEVELAFLQFAVEITESKLPWKDNVRFYPFRVFAFNHFMFVFHHENELHLVLPMELIVEYRKIIAAESFGQINTRNRDLYAYATALTNLYGAYEIEQFVEVWNRHHKDKITLKEAETFLSDRAVFNSDYYLEDGYVVHDCLFADDFDELFVATYNMDYYMPTKSIIKTYAAKGYDGPNLTEFIELKDFLSKFIKDEQTIDDLPYDILHSCERLEKPDSVIACLKEAELPLKDKAFCEKFERLYNNLRNNIHIWELRGHLPHQHQAKTGKSIPRFSLTIK